ncbi:hypothetical protein ACHAWO_011697 [Cyclotella atomus]
MSRQKYQLSSPSLGAEGDSEDGIPPKPNRPLTVFNLFGKLERSYIVQSGQKRAPVPLEIISCTEGIASERSPAAVDPYLGLRPAKYRDIVLPHDWYKVRRSKTQRKFYQAHGIIEFQELSNLVADRWSKVDDETKQFVQTIHDREMVEYRKEMEEYMELYGKVNKRRKVEATKLAATGLSPRDPSMAVSQHSPKTTSTVSDITSHMTQGSTSTPNNDSSKKPDASSSYNQWNQPLNSYVASWPTNPYTSDNNSSERNIPFALVGKGIGSIKLGEELENACDSD